jgi:hypothetical protein
MILRYPLTPKTKTVALKLVEQWDGGKFGQFFHLTNVTAGSVNEIGVIGGIGVHEGAEIPPLSNILELSVYGLVQVNPVFKTKETSSGTSISTLRWEVLLLEELRNAVAIDFAVSEYFLTVNAVGTIINTSGGNLTISAPFQSSAALSGDIVQIQKTYSVANELRSLLGEDLLGQYPELRQAIEDVQEADETHLRERLGSLLATLANLVTVGAGVPMVSKAIEFVGKVIGLT